MIKFTWASLLAALLLAVLLPVLFAELMITSLGKLYLSDTAALLLVVAVFIGSAVNIPVRRIRRSDALDIHPLAAYGVFGFWPLPERVSMDMVIAVNLGGCVIPVGLAFYELLQLAAYDPALLVAAGIASAVSIMVCFSLARPVPGLGIVLPSLVPALLSAGLALLLAPHLAPPVAFIAGVAGPLVGADLLHLRKIEQIQSGIVSIGGAGTFDGIVLSGILAAYLA